MSHTPGPWKYGVRRDGSMWLSLGDIERGPHFQGDLHASEDDARLIAAAPDLLEALKLVADSGKFSCFFDDAWDVVNDAIAKAEGKS